MEDILSQIKVIKEHSKKRIIVQAPDSLKKNLLDLGFRYSGTLLIGKGYIIDISKEYVVENFLNELRKNQAIENMKNNTKSRKSQDKLKRAISDSEYESHYECEFDYINNAR